jgi:hypothetical protein
MQAAPLAAHRPSALLSHCISVPCPHLCALPTVITSPLSQHPHRPTTRNFGAALSHCPNASLSHCRGCLIDWISTLSRLSQQSSQHQCPTMSAAPLFHWTISIALLPLCPLSSTAHFLNLSAFPTGSFRTWSAASLSHWPTAPLVHCLIVSYHSAPPPHCPILYPPQFLTASLSRPLCLTDSLPNGLNSSPGGHCSARQPNCQLHCLITLLIVFPINSLSFCPTVPPFASPHVSMYYFRCPVFRRLSVPLSHCLIAPWTLCPILYPIASMSHCLPVQLPPCPNISLFHCLPVPMHSCPTVSRSQCLFVLLPSGPAASLYRRLLVPRLPVRCLRPTSSLSPSLPVASPLRPWSQCPRRLSVSLRHCLTTNITVSLRLSTPLPHFHPAPLSHSLHCFSGKISFGSKRKVGK